MSRENRQQQKNDANQEVEPARDQQHDQEPEKTRGPSQLGKEAKIGVTAILALLVVLVVVAIIRVTGRHSTEPVAAASAQNKGKPGSVNKGKHNSDLDRGGPRSFHRADTTVVPANAVPAAPPRDSAADPWKSDARKRDSDPMQRRRIPAVVGRPHESEADAHRAASSRFL